ncbi:MAG: WecB/TagA/CpsF family glycosyltransferase [Butyrivibrio sp.]|nr:WecB/TagA/CpsF family glycosyltransferase [Butyrivibrio sp.]
MYEKDSVIGINYVVSNIAEAVLYVKRNAESLKGKYICFSNAHTTVMSYDNEDYRNVQNGAAITFADGESVARQQQRHGHLMAKRVAGPDFMAAMFTETMDGSKKHFFYGSTEETLKKLKENVEKKYPGIVIAGVYSPPFRKLDAKEDEEIVKMINESGADYLWVALGAPKQEKWMAEHKDKIKLVMFGVGAAFDFHAGTIRRAPVVIQEMGMEWLYRLFQDPKRLIGRYFETNIKFMFYTFLSNLKNKQ